MNIHPIFVHFPIALLSLYGIFEIVRFPQLTAQAWWRPLKIGFLLFGTAGALAAIVTGEMAEELIEGTYPIVEMHQLFGKATAIIFGLLCIYYLAELATPKYGARWPWLMSIQKFFPAPVVIVLAVLGLTAVTLTGAIGGAMVYGLNNDPFTSFIVRMLGLAQP